MSPALGIATQPDTSLLSRTEQMMLDTTYRKVLQTLARYKAMPFLELTSVCDISDDELKSILADLESEDLVRVINRGDITEEIVTLRHKGFSVAF
jgi:hypothetical protein